MLLNNKKKNIKIERRASPSLLEGFSPLLRDTQAIMKCTMVSDMWCGRRDSSFAWKCKGILGEGEDQQAAFREEVTQNRGTNYTGGVERIDSREMD